AVFSKSPLDLLKNSRQAAVSQISIRFEIPITTASFLIPAKSFRYCGIIKRPCLSGKTSTAPEKNMRLKERASPLVKERFLKRCSCRRHSPSANMKIHLSKPRVTKNLSMPFSSHFAKPRRQDQTAFSVNAVAVFTVKHSLHFPPLCST